MSFKLFKTEKDEISEIKVIGVPGKPERVPVDIEVIAGQRPTKRSKIKEHFVKEGKDMRGEATPVFNHALWSLPQAARWTEDGEKVTKLFDGDHRRHMFQIAFPKQTHMDAFVVNVADEAEAIGLFIKHNKTRRSAITADQLFICEWNKGEPDSLELGNVLKTIGLRVAADSTVYDALHSVPRNSSKPHVSVNALRRSVAMCTDKKGNFDIAPLKYACAFFSSFGPASEYAAEEFQGMVALGYYFSNVNTNTQWGVWVADRLDDLISTHGSRKDAFVWLKERGGDRHRKSAQCIALGIAEYLRKSKSCPADLKRYLSKPSILRALKR